MERCKKTTTYIVHVTKNSAKKKNLMRGNILSENTSF